MGKITRIKTGEIIVCPLIARSDHDNHIVIPCITDSITECLVEHTLIPQAHIYDFCAVINGEIYTLNHGRG